MLNPTAKSFLLLAALVASVGCGRSNGDPTPAPAPATPAPAMAFADRPAAKAAASCCDWPNWRGPQHDGESRETDWKSTDWPPDGLPVLWSAAVGVGFGSISVAAGSCYTMGHEGELDIVWRLDAADGAVVWKHAYPCKLVDNLHEGGPAATPTIDGDRVYTVSKEGQLFCLNQADGSPRWSVEFQKKFAVKMPEWGFSGSVLIDGELAIVDAGCLAAFDKTSGELVWKTADYTPGYGSPTPFQRAGERLVAVLNNDALLVVRVADGSEAARFPWKTDFATSACTPLVSGDTIFISTGYNRGCALLKLPAKLTGEELAPVYENKHMRNHMAGCVLRDGNLFGFDGNSQNARGVTVVCMELASGKVLWKHRGLGCGSLLLSGDVLLLLSDEGQLVTAPASPKEYRVITSCQALEGRCWIVPTLSHGRIYCRNAAGDLKCLDARRSRP